MRSKGIGKMLEEKKCYLHLLFFSSISENPTLPKNSWGVVRTYTGGLAGRFIYGRFSAVGAGSLPVLFFKSYSELTDKSLFDMVSYGVDFGWSAPSAIVVNAFDPDGRAYAEDEFYKWETADEELAEAAKRFV